MATSDRRVAQDGRVNWQAGNSGWRGVLRLWAFVPALAIRPSCLLWAAIPIAFEHAVRPFPEIARPILDSQALAGMDLRDFVTYGAALALLPYVSLFDALRRLASDGAVTWGDAQIALRTLLAWVVWTAAGGWIAAASAASLWGFSSCGLNEVYRRGGAATTPVYGALLGSAALTSAAACGWLICLLALRIPVAGAVFSVFGSLFVLGFGGLTILAALMTAASWLLIPACGALHRADAFETLSRAYSYLLARPARFAVLFAAAIVQSALLLELASGCLFGLVMATRSMGLGVAAPEAAVERLAQSVTALGTFGVELLAASLFWSAGTVICLILREEEDGMPVTEATWPNADDRNGEADVELPLFGQAAAPPRPRPEASEPEDGKEGER